MTIVNTATGEIIEALDESSAKRLTERIRLIAENVAEQMDKLAGLIDEARTGSAWLAMGYRSWTAYVAGEFAGVLPRLDREPRQEFVRELSARGMSTRAIAPVVGVGDSTVQRDLATRPAPSGAPQTAEPERAEPASVEPQGEGRDESVAPTFAPRPAVTGIDGKTYTSPAPRPKATARELEDFIDSDASVQDSRYMKAVLTIAAAAQALGQYDPARVARVADEHDAMALDNLAATVAEFHRTFTAKRNGLRVIKGGIQ